MLRLCTKCGINEQLRLRTWCRDCYNAYQRNYNKKRYPLVREDLLNKAAEKYAADQEFFDKNAARRKAKRAHWEDQPCEKCGSFPAERHHDDYTQPHVIRWLCKGCHENAHH